MKIKRRLLYSFMVIVIILIGLLSRKISILPVMIGDILWATMMYNIILVITNSKNSKKISIISLGISYIVEFSQLYNSPILDVFRKTTIGHVVLGQGFLFTDLLAYLIGVVLAVLLQVYVDKFSTTG